MKKILMAAVFIVNTTMLFSQKPYVKDSEDIRMEKLRIMIDSQKISNDAYWQHQLYVLDSTQKALSIKQMSGNMDGFMYEVRERERKAKQQMWVRLGLGIGFLIIGIFGIMRRRKKDKPVT